MPVSDDKFRVLFCLHLLLSFSLLFYHSPSSSSLLLFSPSLQRLMSTMEALVASTTVNSVWSKVSAEELLAEMSSF